MRTIKFSHLYKKMPQGVELCDTWLKDIALIDYSELTPEEIEQDTAIVGGGNYPLPHMRLIWLKLWTDCFPEPKEWGTMRPYNQGKFDYYKSLIGQQVKIEIVKGDNQL